MQVYFIQEKRLSRAREQGFSLERDMQQIVEHSLKEVFGLELITSEFNLKGMRIDTLAFDPESQSFVIIEFKKDKNSSVVDQGYAYLGRALEHKAELVLAYNERFDEGIKKDDIDWSQTRVIFVSPEFTDHQIGAINFKDLPIELWEMRKYEKDIVVLNRLTPSGTSASIMEISARSPRMREVARQVRVPSESDHLKGIPEEVAELYEDLKRRLLDLGNVSVVPKKKYIGFKRTTNFADVHICKSHIKMWLNVKKGELEDPKGLARDVSRIGHWGNGDYELTLKPGIELDYIIMLAKSSYDRN